MPVGTYGRIDFLKVGPKRVRARARVRDYDGVSRSVTRYGPSRAAAERRLKEALRDRTGPTHGAITADTRVHALADVWRAEMKASDLSDGSKDLYERTLTSRVVPALGGLLIRECGVPATDRFLKAIRENHGPSAAKTAKTVTSLLLALAVRHGALPANPIRDVGKIPRGTRSRPRALTVVEETDLLKKGRADPAALADRVPGRHWERIGEGMAMDWPANEHRAAVPGQAGQGAEPSNANRDLRAAVQRTDP